MKKTSIWFKLRIISEYKTLKFIEKIKSNKSKIIIEYHISYNLIVCILFLIREITSDSYMIPIIWSVIFGLMLLPKFIKDLKDSNKD